MLTAIVGLRPVEQPPRSAHAHRSRAQAARPSARTVPIRQNAANTSGNPLDRALEAGFGLQDRHRRHHMLAGRFSKGPHRRCRGLFERIPSHPPGHMWRSRKMRISITPWVRPPCPRRPHFDSQGSGDRRQLNPCRSESAKVPGIGAPFLQLRRSPISSWKFFMQMLLSP